MWSGQPDVGGVRGLPSERGWGPKQQPPGEGEIQKTAAVLHMRNARDSANCCKLTGTYRDSTEEALT